MGNRWNWSLFVRISHTSLRFNGYLTKFSRKFKRKYCLNWPRWLHSIFPSFNINFLHFALYMVAWTFQCGCSNVTWLFIRASAYGWLFENRLQNVRGQIIISSLCVFGWFFLLFHHNSLDYRVCFDNGGSLWKLSLSL